MTPEQREELLRLLEKGEEISPEWARILFPPEKREYELVYYGKDREEDIIADTLAVPLQAGRTFGRDGVNWHNMLIFGDNLQAMKTLLEMKKTGNLCNSDGTPGVRMAYIDPPFATKQEFSGTQDQRAYQDKIAGADFLEFLRKRFVLIRELLSDDGSIIVHLDLRKGHYCKLLLDEVFEEKNFRNEVIWKRTGARSDSATYNHIHDTLFLYTRSNQWIWNVQHTPYTDEYIEKFFDGEDADGRKYRKTILTAPGTRRGSSGMPWRGIDPTKKGRHWAIPGYVRHLLRRPDENNVLRSLDDLNKIGRVVWPAKEGGVPSFKQYLNEMEGVELQSVWTDVRPVAANALEATFYPTQKPEALAERIITSSSNKGDIVLDAFAGSGTTCAVAEKLRRRWIGIDCGKLAIYTIQKRMLNLCREIGNKGTKLEPKPFTLYNAGLYDFSTLKQLPWKDWRFFALQLFGCRNESHKIGGIEFDGYRQGYSVMVFNHMETKHKGACISEETIQEIHEAAGSRMGSKVFIVAPALAFDFQQDYIDLEKVRYYALRIPYSMIHELHRREFTALKQPSDEMAVNDTVEAVGFDFIRTPELKYKTGSERPKGELFELGFIRIETFKSDAVIREPFKKKGNLETLSMVMLDFDYDEANKVFDLDAVYYADALEKEDWKVRFQTDQLGKKMMAAFLDIYGNETRVLIDAADFGKTKSKKKSGKKK